MPAPVHKELVIVDAGKVRIEGMLERPSDPSGVILFAHGSGSSRLSPRNNFVARILQDAGFATLLMDLLTPAEDEALQSRFDIVLLAQRLHAASLWLQQHNELGSLPVGVFGASTGAAAALQLAALPDSPVRALVSRGGRPGLAGIEALSQVRAPSLLIVGGLDHVVINLNQQAFAAMHCEKRIAIVPGASHLFEEPGTLQTAAGLARDWFVAHLAPRT